MLRKAGKKIQEKEAKKASRTLFEVGAYNRDKEGDSTLNKLGESSVQSIAKEEDTDGLAALVDHETTESRESTTDSSLNQDTVHSGSSSFDVGIVCPLPHSHPRFSV